MQSTATTVKQYLDELPDERKEILTKLRKVITDNLPPGFSEGMGYGNMGYSVPHTIYPDGYHCDPSVPLPFMGMASQKHFVALYHMGIYADKELHDWFVTEYPKHAKTKLDMGKSCIRFKKMNDIPYELVGQLAAKMTVKQWIALYENNLKNSRKQN